MNKEKEVITFFSSSATIMEVPLSDSSGAAWDTRMLCISQVFLWKAVWIEAED